VPTLPLGVRIFVALDPVDMRRSFDGLAAWVQQRLGLDPLPGHLVLFRNKRGNLMKLLFYDRSGYTIIFPGLERGTFQLPEGSLQAEVDLAQLGMIIEGSAIALITLGKYCSFLAWRAVLCGHVRDHLEGMLGEDAEERRAQLVRQREEAQAILAASTPATTAPPTGALEPSSPAAKPPQKRHAHGRGTPPADLPRDTRSLAPPQCDAFGCTRLWLRKTLVSEEYDFVQAYLRVRRTERSVCQCADCKRVPTSAQPPMPFERASCTFALMAWVLYTRAGLFLPLDRLGRELERMGARIPSATLTRWWGRGADLLLPVAASVRLSLLQGTHIRSDGTGLRVVFPRLLAAPRAASPGRARSTPMATCSPATRSAGRSWSSATTNTLSTTAPWTERASASRTP
jgi:transposase